MSAQWNESAQASLIDKGAPFPIATAWTVTLLEVFGRMALILGAFSGEPDVHRSDFAKANRLSGSEGCDHCFPLHRRWPAR